MDIDLNLSDDKIKSFLENKLQEICSKNLKLEKKCLERSTYRKSICETNSTVADDLKIVEVNKKIHNNKFIFRIIIENLKGRILTSTKIFIHSTYNLVYKTILYEANENLSCESLSSEMDLLENLKIVNEINQKVFLIIVVDVPKFLQETLYEIEGNVSYEENMTTKSFILPKLNMKIEDITDRNITISIFKQDIFDIISLINTNQKNHFVMVLPQDWNSCLETIFEIHCSLTKLKIISKFKLYFVTHNMSKVFDNALVEVNMLPNPDCTNAFDVKIYSRNEDEVNYLLHHFYNNIPGVLFLTKETFPNYNQLCSPNTESQNSLEDSEGSIKKELIYVLHFLEQSKMGKNTQADVIKFRQNLIDIEFNTDSIYITAVKE